MKNLLFTLALLISFGSYAQEKTKIYKGLTEAMSKSEVKAEMKKNKDDYKEVGMGNGVVWTIKKTGMLYVPKDNLIGIWMWPKGTLLSGLGYDATVSYLQEAKRFFVSRDYEILLENEYWDKPQNFTGKGYAYGLVLVSPDQKRVVHLYPAEITLMDGKSTNMQAYLKVLTKSYWDSEMSANAKKREQDTKDTDF
jgi:hypothetical protein